MFHIAATSRLVLTVVAAASVAVVQVPHGLGCSCCAASSVDSAATAEAPALPIGGDHGCCDTTGRVVRAASPSDSCSCAADNRDDRWQTLLAMGPASGRDSASPAATCSATAGLTDGPGLANRPTPTHIGSRGATGPPGYLLHCSFLI